jgi:bacterioferritin
MKILDRSSDATNPAKGGDHLSDIAELRRRARSHMDQGAVTPGYEGDVQTAVRILNEALATEIVCTLRYRSHYYMAEGIHSESIKAEFLEHANEEQMHADQIADRIRQLGGTPNFSPEGILSRSHAEFQQGESITEMLREDLYAERIAIESYREMVRYFGEKDSTSRRLMEEILAKEEEHADDLQTLLVALDRSGAERSA